MPIVGFQPDPSFPDAGWYVDDAGNKRYGRAGMAPIDTSQATAGGGGMLDHLAPWLNRSGGDQRPAAPPTASDVSVPTPGVPPQPRQGVSVPYDSVPHPPEAALPPNVPAAAPAMPGQPVYQPDPAARQGMADAKTDALGQGTAAAILREQGQRPHVVRGGMTPTGMTTSVTGATPVTDEVRSQVHDSYNASKNAADASAMAEVGGYNEQRDLYRQQAADELVAKAAKEKQVNEINGYVTQDRADLANAQAELAQNQKDFNPNRLVQGAPGVMGAIFRAMGAWAQVRGHQANNSAADTIDAIVSRDVMQQKQAIDDAKGKVGNVQAQLREHFGDAQLAETAHRALALSWAKNMVQATLAQTGSQTALANGQATIADLSRRQAEAENNFTKQSMGVRSEQVNAQMRPDQVVGGPVGVDKALEREHKQAEIDKLRAEAGKTKETKGPGWRAQQAVAAGNTVMGQIDDALGAMGLDREADGNWKTPGYGGRVGTRISAGAAQMFQTENGAKLDIIHGMAPAEMAKIMQNSTEPGIKEASELLKSNDPVKWIQARRLIHHMVVNQQNAARNVQPGYDATAAPTSEEVGDEEFGR